MKALIVVDPQYDFFEGGSLEVKDSNKIIPIINKLTKSNQFDLVIFTKDWHPSNHKSFASQHDGKNVFDLIELNEIPQVLWPNHCVQNTHGAEFHHNLNLNIPNLYIFKKGMNIEVDSYSAFYENDHKTSTGLTDFLKEKNINDIYLVGIAGEYCVGYTAIDGSNEKFNTFVIEDGVAYMSEEGKIITNKKLLGNNINIINSQYFLTQ